MRSAVVSQERVDSVEHVGCQGDGLCDHSICVLPLEVRLGEGRPHRADLPELLDALREARPRRRVVGPAALQQFEQLRASLDDGERLVVAAVLYGGEKGVVVLADGDILAGF